MATLQDPGLVNGSLAGTPRSEAMSAYEQSREERIRANLEAMQKLGIFDLSLKLKLSANENLLRSRAAKKKHSNGDKTPPPHASPLLRSEPTRRSSRLKSGIPVSYSEVDMGKKNKVALYDEEDLLNDLGSKVEMYTEEHEKLLGNTEKTWTLFVDGYGADGKRIYDQVKGQTCHQCRQKTLGHHTSCISCNKVQGQFCGDCLYMRYGEHVLEAKENSEWICPVCRGICNCSLCRNSKGWVPTGALYKKVTRLGYKSVAHYLIQTRRSVTKPETNHDAPNEVSVKRSLAFSDTESVQVNQLIKSEDKSDNNIDIDAQDSEIEEKVLSEKAVEMGSVKRSLAFSDVEKPEDKGDNINDAPEVNEVEKQNNVDENTPLLKPSKLKQKRGLDVALCEEDSIGARLRQRRKKVEV